MSIDADAVQQLGVVALVSGIMALIIFGSDREPETSFRVFPRNASDQVSVWFHTLEFILFCSMYASLHPASRGLSMRAQGIVDVGAVVSMVLLAVSAMTFWPSDR